MVFPESGEMLLISLRPGGLEQWPMGNQKEGTEAIRASHLLDTSDPVREPGAACKGAVSPQGVVCGTEKAQSRI